MRTLAMLVGKKTAGAVTLGIVLVAYGCGGGSSGSGFTTGGDDGGIGTGSDGGFGSGGSDGGSKPNTGAPTTCIVGTQGCLCDSTGGCAPGLTCVPQTAPSPSLCCNGSDCTATGGTVGKSCSAASGAASCTPGVTISAASGGNDGCGYPSSTFSESSTLCAITASGGGATPAIVRLYYNDEHALTLGCGTTSDPVSPLASDPEALKYPQVGDPACTDSVNRPLRPVLFVTDISGDPSCNAGDQQQGGQAYDPIAVFGTWKIADEGTDHVGSPPRADPSSNNWNLTASADPVPTTAQTKCTEGFSAELRYEVGLISGHSYRLQVMAHDGDQTRGADSGEACAVFCAGTGSLCDSGVTQCPDGNSSVCPGGTTCEQGCCVGAPR
ncbi:MAG: hypothetical protein ACRELY_27300 [Polyangiaceae bacterium]